MQESFRSGQTFDHSTIELPPKIARHCRSPKRFSVSNKFYENIDDTQMDEVLAKNSIEARKYMTKQSQRLPRWVWFLIAKALGIPLHARDKPILATILHILTFSSAITFVASQIWYIAYDISSAKTRQDMLSGTVSILIATMWAALGLYAKSLSGRLFRYPRFLADIRMHARTVFKINAAFLVFSLGLFFIIIQDMQSADLLYEKTCQIIEMEVIVCQIQFVSRVIFSIFSLIWNTLVAIVLISLCRTHTIGIRRFIRELEFDALMHDHYHCEQYQESPMSKEDICEETFWLEEDLSIFGEDDSRFVVVHRKNDSQTDKSSSFSSMSTTDVKDVTEETDEEINTIPPKLEDIEATLQDIPEVRVEVPEEKINKNLPDDEGKIDIGDPASTNRDCDPDKISKFFPIKCGSGESNIEDAMLTPHTMTSAEILHKYWKISCRLRMTSCALQRWMASLIALIIVWCFIYLIHWQEHTPSAHDVLQFLLPLLLLPLLCSAFAEVNMEGTRMTQCLCPTEERLHLLRFLNLNKLSMTIYGVSLSYGTIMTVIFAIFAAFTSRLIFAEMSKTTLA